MLVVYAALRRCLCFRGAWRRRASPRSVWQARAVLLPLRDGEHRGRPAAILTLASVAGAAGAAITSRAGV